MKRFCVKNIGIKNRIWLSLVAVLWMVLFTGCGEEQTGEAQAGLTVSFSHESGVYAEGFELTITVPKGYTISYTLDGSNPVDNSDAIIYKKPIKIEGRSRDFNEVSAVDPGLISGNYNKVNKKNNAFESILPSVTDEAVDKCTVVRTVITDVTGKIVAQKSQTFFIGTMEEHIKGLSQSCEASGNSLAVISISMNYEDLFDYRTGIYVKGYLFDNALSEYLVKNKLQDGETARSLDANYMQKGQKWERLAAVTMFEVLPEGTKEVFTQNCGIRIQGDYSRSDLQKGLRLFARDEYGKSNFDYAVFGEDYVNDAGEVMDQFKTLVLRAGGNCAFTAKFNDTYWQSLVADMNCETQKSRPCVVYINGEYWGLYILQEDYTDEYFENLHGVKKEDVVIYKGVGEASELGYKLDEGTIPEEEEESFYFSELLAFFESHSDLKAQEDYDAFVQLVDPDSVMDYFAVQCYINNKWDWPGKEWSMWRTTTIDENNPYADGRWRYMFYDMEFGGVSGESDAYVNTIKEAGDYSNGLLDLNTDNPAVRCFAYLMTNENFRNSFYERITGLSTGNLGTEQALSKLDEFESIYSPLYGQFFDRYPGTGSKENALNGSYATAKCIRKFVEKRANYIQQMIDYCEKTLGN